MSKSKKKRPAEHAKQPKRDAEHEPGSDELSDAELLSDEELDEVPPIAKDSAATLKHAARAEGGGTVIFINRGRADGVKKDMEGILKGLDVKFTITVVNEDDCTAILDEPLQQVREHKQVLLNTGK